MKKTFWRASALLAVTAGLYLMLGIQPFALASGHGCATREPDRDGDGIPDKSDAFPDDPSRFSESDNQPKYCGNQPAVLKLYFVPFKHSSAAGITKESIEKKAVNSYWFCAPNDAVKTIQNILDKNSAFEGNEGASQASAGSPVSRKAARYGLLGEENSAANTEPNVDSEPGREAAEPHQAAAVTVDAEVNPESIDEKLKKITEGLESAAQKIGGAADSSEAPKNSKEVKDSTGAAVSEEDDLDKLFDSEEADLASKSNKGVSSKALGTEAIPQDLETSGVGAVDGALSAGLLDQNQIRLKVVEPQNAGRDTVYLVDQLGQGIKNGQPFKLGARQMAAIEAIVESLSGVVDLNLKPVCSLDSSDAAKAPSSDLPI